ncbi:MAG: glycosyl transferase [Sporomusa sp.]|jgi:glycosyltransferase involved in cell wall biosynthesis|nr:glycosyl transferase [Sporomusa sp.]
MNFPSSIDVIIPVFNGERYISEALKSVADQTYKPNRIIVVDDGSTDDTAKETHQCSKEFHVPITYLYKSNGGHSSARNMGIAASDSDFIAFLDADDLWDKYKLEAQISVFHQTSFPNLGVVYSDITVIDGQGAMVSQYDGYRLNPQLRGDIFQSLISGNLISSSASGVLIRRNCFEQVGVFDETLPTSEDWDMWLRLAEQYEFDYVNDKLVKIRCHTSNTSKKRYLMIKGRIMVLNKLYVRYPDNPQILQELRYQVLCLIGNTLASGRSDIGLAHLLDEKTRADIINDPKGIFYSILRGCYRGVRKLVRRIG